MRRRLDHWSVGPQDWTSTHERGEPERSSSPAQAVAKKSGDERDGRAGSLCSGRPRRRPRHPGGLVPVRRPRRGGVLETGLEVTADLLERHGGSPAWERPGHNCGGFCTPDQGRDAAYEAENIIDAADYRARRNSMRKGMLGAISRYARKPKDLVARHKLGKDVLRWRKKIQDIKSSREFLEAINVGGRTRAQSSSCMPRTLRLPAYHDDEASVVGLDADAERIEEWLKDCLVTPQLTVISIVAMGGAGKTTLARKVYNSAAVEEHFDVFAFVSISQQFEVLPVLKEIARQTMGIKKRDRGFENTGLTDELKKMGEQELEEMLHGFLERKRYLIVLDDVWRMDTWDVLQHAIPDQGNGSRLMLTTRDSQVAKQANKLTRVHKIRLLNEQESWQLFSLKAFPSYENIDDGKRQELESVGRNLAQKCRGLPLALVVLGSHLSKNLYLDTWLKMECCLDWEVTSKWDNMQQIIALSYDDLSHSLKDCFLYIASFPEDSKIIAGNLTRNWIAEGFLQHRPNRTLEEIAYDYLGELVQRSMVHIIDWDDTHGQISAVQIHDILREWVMRKVREEGFLKVCKSCDDISAGTSAYRLSFLDCFDDRIFTSAPNMRSMLGFNLPCVTLGTQRFIRVLYMVDTNLEKISDVLGHLIHLRYIGLIRCRNVVLPSSIGNLLNLESINLTGTCIPRVPQSLWDIPTLRHVEIPWVAASFTPTTIRAVEQSELQTLYIGAEWHAPNKVGSDSTGWIRLKEHLMRMAQLRTLVLLDFSFLPVDVLICLKELRHLRYLHLHLWETIDAFLESGQLPQNLRTLVLCFHGPLNSWHADLLSTLGRFQHLVSFTLFVDDVEDKGEQLTSKCCKRAGVPTYKAPVMSSPTGAFPRLRYLNLFAVQANKLRFHAGTMPNLIELRFAFGHMTTVPDGLFDLPSLEKLFLCKMKNVQPRDTHELLDSKGIRVIIED